VSRPLLFALVGVLWCARSLQSFADPSFADPETVGDWFAVISVSVALLALAVALPLFARLIGGRATYAISLVAAAGATIGAVGNLLEDGAQLGWAGDGLYFPGVILFVLGLVALTVTVAMTGRGRTRLLALVPATTLVGTVLLEAGGGVLVLAAWLAAAAWGWRQVPEPGAR
jgi:hypothetical protein